MPSASEPNKFGLFSCPCCDFFTLPQRAGNTFFTCPVCFWEDDGVQLDDPDYMGGANGLSLNQARENYRKFGASEECLLSFVRPADYRERP